MQCEAQNQPPRPITSVAQRTKGHLNVNMCRYCAFAETTGANALCIPNWKAEKGKTEIICVFQRIMQK